MDELFERLDHTSVAVANVEEVLPLMELVGAQFFEGADNERNGFRWVQYVMPGGKLEFIAPTRDDSFLHTFLDSRGPGLHHVTFKVSNLDAAIVAAETAGYEVVERHAGRNWEEAFLRPRSTHGVLVQLATWDDAVPGGSSDLAEVLAGRVFDGA